MSLKERLIEQIALEGPISVADYMAQCLFDPKDGYYATRPALGADGDFITSLMQPVTENGKFASWISPPKVGIDNKPGDFEYVKIET